MEFGSVKLPAAERARACGAQSYAGFELSAVAVSASRLHCVSTEGDLHFCDISEEPRFSASGLRSEEKAVCAALALAEKTVALTTAGDFLCDVCLVASLGPPFPRGLQLVNESHLVAAGLSQLVVYNFVNAAIVGTYSFSQSPEPIALLRYGDTLLCVASTLLVSVFADLSIAATPLSFATGEMPIVMCSTNDQIISYTESHEILLYSEFPKVRTRWRFFFGSHFAFPVAINALRCAGASVPDCLVLSYANGLHYTVRAEGIIDRFRTQLGTVLEALILKEFFVIACAYGVTAFPLRDLEDDRTLAHSFNCENEAVKKRT